MEFNNVYVVCTLRWVHPAPIYLTFQIRRIFRFNLNNCDSKQTLLQLILKIKYSEIRMITGTAYVNRFCAEPNKLNDAICALECIDFDINYSTVLFSAFFVLLASKKILQECFSLQKNFLDQIRSVVARASKKKYNQSDEISRVFENVYRFLLSTRSQSQHGPTYINVYCIDRTMFG